MVGDGGDMVGSMELVKFAFGIGVGMASCLEEGLLYAVAVMYLARLQFRCRCV